MDISVIDILAMLIPILSALGGITYCLGRKFSEIYARFNEIDKRFEAIDKRFESIDRKFEELKEYIDMRITRLGEAFRSYQEFFIEYLTSQGWLKPLEASMLKN
ncbi:MAG: hypothetical protein QXQ57_03130 [Sulfolobales archaeon]